MSKTLTAGDAVRIVAARYPRLDTSGFAARFCDEVLSTIWHRYPWRESLAELPPFHLVREEPDYGAPLLAVPPDFYGLHRVCVRNSYGTTYPPLIVVHDLSVSQSTGIPTAIAYQPEKRSFRVYPRPLVGAPDFWIEGSYKKVPQKITTATLNSYFLPFDDMYFNVFRLGLVWKVKEILGDSEAVQDEARFYRAIDEMAVAEGLHSGVIVVAPAEGLELGG